MWTHFGHNLDTTILGTILASFFLTVVFAFLFALSGLEPEIEWCPIPVGERDSAFESGGVDSDIDSLFCQRPSDADSNCPKMGQSQRWFEEGGFEGGGVGSFEIIILKE